MILLRIILAGVAVYLAYSGELVSALLLLIAGQLTDINQTLSDIKKGV